MKKSFRMPSDIVAALAKPIVGNGGFQAFGRHLQSKMKVYVVIELTKQETSKLKRYATKYGNGGFQGRLAKLI